MKEMMMRKLMDNVDFKFVISEGDKDYVHIEILTGEYKNTVFKFGKVGIEEKDNEAYLQFDYEVVSSPIKKVDKNIEFKNYIGDILLNIITSKLDIEEGYYDENRTDDSEESDSQ
jgi:hypothetical protein